MYCKLAAFLASYNELGIDAVFATERFHSGKSAVHILEDVAISWEAQERWARVYVDDQWEPTGDVLETDFVSFSYCLGTDSGERVICRWEAQRRIMFPLWWDPEHRVSGNDGRSRIAESCADARCFHVPRQPLEY